jgi:hypothetical protein
MISWHTVHYEYLKVFAYLFLSFYVFRFLLHLLGMNVFNVYHQYHKLNVFLLLNYLQVQVTSLIMSVHTHDLVMFFNTLRFLYVL